MISRDFRIGWRLLLRQPFHSVVEILGLATGFAICFLLLGFVRYSFSYDSDVPERERVFVIKHRLNFIPQPQWMEYTPFALRGVALQSGLPMQVSAWWPRQPTLRLQGRAQAFDVTVVDPAFQDIAGLRAAEGDLRQALTRPDGLAVTRQTARRLFGDVPALGRTLEINRQQLQVRAVLPDRPSNSTIQFTALVGTGSALWSEREHREGLANWMGIGGRIYVKTGAGVTPEALQNVLQDAVDRAPWQNLATPELKAALGGRKMVDIGLGPLADAYFDRSVANTMGTGPRGDMRMVLAIGAAGGLVLLLAVVNYVNLATVRTLRRQREIAVRRVLGATTRQLLAQFMAEAMLLSLAASALGVLMAWLLLPLCSDLLQRRLDGMFTPAAIAACLLLGVLVGAAAGLYPGWLARGVDMRETLANRSGETACGAWLRRVLTATQFAAAMAMGGVALAILWQTRFAAAAAPGFDPLPLLVLELPQDAAGPAAGAFDGAAQIVLAAAWIGVEHPKAAGQHFAERRVLFELGHDIGGGHATGRYGDRFVHQSGWGDLGGLQAERPFDDQCQCQHGAGQQRPDRPAGRLYDRKQEDSPVRLTTSPAIMAYVPAASGNLKAGFGLFAHSSCG